MRIHVARAILIAVIAVSACSGSSQDQDTTDRSAAAVTNPVTSGAVADSMQPSDSMSEDHSGHQMPGMQSAGTTPGDDPHAGHAATSSSTSAGASPSTAGASAGGHEGHAAADAPARSEDHTRHDDTAAASHTGHAAAPAPRRDASPDAHAAHAAPTTSQNTAHSAHAASTTSQDTTHAAHAASTTSQDTTHAAHAASTMSPETTHAAHATSTMSRDPAHTTHSEMAGTVPEQDHGMHRMWTQPLGGGWNLIGMAQAYPMLTMPLGADDGSSLDRTELYLTQPAAMFNIESPGSRITLRTTLNFEGITQPDGELTAGGWGEGFLDKRHPHTLLHEFMLSVNFPDVAGGAFSVSAGKGFAPYGTDDPMSRPAVKYPTNHHLSQILERWTVNGVYLNRGWSVEAAIFGGGEPVGPYDLSNIESFGDSWSARVARRFGAGAGPMAEWEASASYAQVREVHHGEAETTNLANAALRHETTYGFGNFYGLVEGSVSQPGDDGGYFSLLGETRIAVGAHQPYYRIEYATRPEYAREGAPGTQEFFRYDHDAHSIGSTRWLINVVGYGYELTGYPVSARPFVELQHNRVSEESGGIDPVDLFGARSFWGLSAGFRVFLGGDPMRMGSYGVLDAITAMNAGAMAAPGGMHTDHE